MPDVPPGFDDLSKEEQIEYVQALWNRIASDESNVPVPEWHLQIVRERLASDDGEATESWSSVHERLKHRNDG
jgi:hypothetical protein